VLKGGPLAQADFVGGWEVGIFGADAVTDLLIELSERLEAFLGIWMAFEVEGGGWEKTKSGKVVDCSPCNS